MHSERRQTLRPPLRRRCAMVDPLTPIRICGEEYGILHTAQIVEIYSFVFVSFKDKSALALLSSPDFLYLTAWCRSTYL